MRGKLTAKTIVISIIVLLVLGAAITGTVLFLKDSGEAAATGEVPSTTATEKIQSTEDNEQLNDNEKIQVQKENTEDNQNVEENVNETDNNAIEEDNNQTNQTENVNQGEPAPTTIEREKIVSETTLGWNNIELNSKIDTTNLEINYNNLEYKVEYYFDGVLDEETSVIIGGNSKGKIIDSYEEKVKEGYKLDKVENLPLTITENEEENVIKVSYIKDENQTKELKYTVRYYLENVEQEKDKKEVKETVWVNAEETMKFDATLLNKEYTGYKKVKTNPETIGTTVKSGAEIKVYYEIDRTKTKELKYTVRYYLENVEQEKDKKEVKETVWVNAEETMKFDATLLNKEYTGYKKVKTNPETIGTTVKSGAEIKVYYEKASYDYTIYYYKDNIAGKNLLGRIPGTAKFGSEIIADTTKFIPEEGYVFVGTTPSMTICSDSTKNVLNVIYTKVNNLSYTINYLEKGTNKVLKTETVPNQEFNTIITISKLKIPNKITVDSKEYAYSNKFTTAQEPPITGEITIKTDLNLNVINLYYERPEIKAKKTSIANTTSTEAKVAHAGDEITYTIKVWNEGSGDKEVTITDTQPTGTTILSNTLTATSGKTNLSNGKITWQVNALAGSLETTSAQTLTFKVKINDNATGKITNTAYIDGEKGPSDDGYSIKKPSDITVSKTSSNKSGEVKYGDFITYTLTAKNDGDEGGTVVIRDADLKTLVDSGKVKLTTSSVELGSLANGAPVYVPAHDTKTIIYTVKVTANVATNIKNRVEVIQGGKVDDDHKEVDLDTVKYVTVNKLKEITTHKNIIIAIDKSASMIGRDYEKAKKAVQNIIDIIYPNSTAFTNNLINTKVIAYAGKKYFGSIDSCSTIGSASNFSSAEKLKKEVGITVASGEWTNLKNTLEYIAREVDTSASKENNIIIFVGDGGTGYAEKIEWSDCVDASNSLKAISTVFTVDVGNSNVMRNMASSTNTYSRVDGYNTNGLTDALKKIITTVTVDKETMTEKTNAEGKILLEGIIVDSNHPITINSIKYTSMPKTIVPIGSKNYLDLIQFKAGETVSITYYRQ